MNKISNKKEINQPIRIAQIIGKWVGGGVEAVVMNYYRHIDRNKIQFDFICDSDSTNIPYEEIENLGGKVILVPPYQKVVAYHKELKKIFKENNYQIVHSHINTLSVFPLYAAKCAGVPVRIAHSHSTTNKKEWKKNLIKQALRPFSKVFATHYFACSELAGRWLFSNKEYDKGNVFLLNNAIDVDKFQYDEKTRKEMRKELKIKDDTIVIGHIGRFMPQKNHDFLIDIFNEYHKLNKNSILILAGQGPLENEIKEKVKELQLEDSVKFLGQRHDANKLYQAFDLFLLPSLYEGLPVVGVEAQAAGLLCILSESMTKETKVLDSTKFISLEQSANEWANVINKELSNYKRKDTSKEITDNGFNINIEANKLLFKYKRIQNKIKIFVADSNNCYPVPAVNGGAVQTLVEHFVESFNSNDIELEIVSFFDEEALKKSKKYKNVKFKWIKIPKFIKFFDNIFFNITKFINEEKSLSFRRFFSLIWYILIASNYLRKNKDCKVILENNIPIAWIIRLSRFNGNYYYHFHNIPKLNAFCKTVFKKCTKFMCVSEFVANNITSSESAIGIIDKNKVTILHNCINTTLFNIENNVEKLKKYKDKYNLSKNDFVILFVGRITKEKGVDKVIDAILKLEDNNIKLLIVGNIIHKSNIKDKYQELLYKKSLQLKDKIIFTGYVNQDELKEIYNIGDVAVLPSIWEEPAGLTMIEAIACGIPLITTISGGIPEYVENNSILLKNDNNLVNNISKEIIKIKNNKPKNLIKSSQIIREKFNSENYFQNLIDLIY